MRTFQPIIGALALSMALSMALPAPAFAGIPVGSEWRPVKIGHENLFNTKQRVRFDADNRITGNGGCNGFGGDYTLGGDTIMISQLTMTMMACPGEIMKQERLFLRALGAATHYQRDGTSLVLLDGTGKPVAELIERH